MKKIMGLILTSSLMFTGCSSLVLTASDKNPKPYEGVRMESSALGTVNFLATILILIDFLPSLTMDTILLPYTIPCAAMEDYDRTHTDNHRPSHGCCAH